MTSSIADKLPLKHFWANHEQEIWLASFFRLRRNLKTHVFPEKLKPSFKKELTDLLRAPLLKNLRLKNAPFFYLKNLSRSDQQYLESYFLTSNFYAPHHAHEGLIFEPKQKVHIALNIEDHIVLNLIETNMELEGGYNKLLNIETELGKDIEFAFSKRFGFLTSDYKKCGLGLDVGILLHLPALNYKNLATIDNSSQCELFSFFKSESSTLGDLFILKKNQKIGITEEQFLQSLHSQALHLVLLEKKEREIIQKANSHPLKNKIGKAFGSLKHAEEVEVKEAIALLSLCKLGVEINFIKNLPLKKLNPLFFSTTSLMIGKDKARAKLIKTHIEKASI